MISSVVGAGIILAVLSYFLDFVLWTYVFNKGLDHLSSLSGNPEKLKSAMGPMLAQSAAGALVFGVVFAMIYGRLRGSLWAGGVMGGMEFGTLLWLPTVAVASLGNGIWYDKARPLARATFWAWLIKLNVVGFAAALLMK